MLVSSRVTTNILLVLVLAACAILIAMVATGVRGGPLDPPGPPGQTAAVRIPGTPISGPTTISSSGHYYLTNNVTIGLGIAITINADAVTLDLGGFSLDGTDTAGSYGVSLSGSRRNIRIMNGTISDFQFGVDAGDDQLVAIEDVQITSNVRGLQLGHASRASDCMVSDNTETGIYITGERSLVSECSVVLNDVDGIATAASLASVNTIERSIVVGNSGKDIRLQAPFNTIRDNRVFSVALDSGLNQVIDNECSGGIIDEANPGNSYVPIAGTAHDNISCQKQ